jgi:adenylate cyclase
MARSVLPESIKKRGPVIIAAVMTAFFVFLTFQHSDLNDESFLTSLEHRWIDAKFRMRGEQLPAGNVVIVAIDDRTLKLGSFRTLRHSYYAQLVDKLSAAHPKVIGFDMMFPDPDLSHPDDDRQFGESLSRAGNVVLGMWLDLESTAAATEVHETNLTPELESLVSEKQVFPAEINSSGTARQTSELIKGRTLQLNLSELMEGAYSFGFVNFHPDAEGRLRYQPQFIDYQNHLYPSLDIQLLRKYLDAPSPVIEETGEQMERLTVGDHQIPIDKFGRYMVNFNAKAGTFQTVSMIDVMEDRVSPNVLKDKIVLIGPVAVGLGDIRPTPFDPIMPGVELHATVIDNILTGRYLYRNATTNFVDIAIVLTFGVLLGLYLPRLNASRSVFYSLLLLALFTVANIMSFSHLHWVLGFVYPGMGLFVTSGSMIAWKYWTEEREKKRTKETFKYYLDQHVVEQVINQPELLKLGGEKRELSVLFSDIRGFTSFSEKMAPTEVVQFLNQYFDKMQGLIFQYKGTLDKLIGDAVMCFWGAPIETRDHALRAVVTALEMIHSVDDLRSVLILPGGAKFEIGIGVNTGQMVVGNMGSETRMSYTVMGDNVNLGSRLESLNKYYGTRILISDSTFEAVRHLVFCRELDTIQVKGKTQAVTIYEPMGIRRQPDDRRNTVRRTKLTTFKRIKRAYVMALHGDRRKEDRRLGSDRLVLKPDQEEIAAMYEHALSLYRKGDFDAAEMGFDHVLTLSPNDGPARLMKSRISKYRLEYAGAASPFDPVYKFDEK